METSVIILNYNGAQCVSECIRTMLQSEYQDFDIILVDNASADDSIAKAEKEFAEQIASRKIRLILSKTNTGFAQGNNLGYHEVHEDTNYVALLNMDAIVPKEWLGKLVETMKQHKDVAICGSLIINKVKDVDVKKELESFDWRMHTLNMEFSTEAPATWHHDDLFDLFFVSGNGMIVRKQLYSTLFNPAYFAYSEDIDIGWTTRMRGLRVVMRKDAYLLHHNSIAKKSNPQISKIAVFNGTKNQFINYFTHYEWKNIIRIFPLLTLTQCAQAAYQPSKIIVKAKAVFWTITNFRRIMQWRKQVQNLRKVKDAQLIKLLSGKVYYEEIAPQGWKRTFLRMLNNISLCYCRIVGLQVVELRKTKAQK